MAADIPKMCWPCWADDAPQLLSNDLREIATPTDFLGVNYYFPERIENAPGVAPIATRVVETPGVERTAFGWEVDPEGMVTLLSRIQRDYAPACVYLTENGSTFEDEMLPDGRVEDVQRRSYLQRHLAAAQRAMAAGVPLKGYFAWSLLDNFEWAEGYLRRFGLAYVDFETQQRTLKASGQWYAPVPAAWRGGPMKHANHVWGKLALLLAATAAAAVTASAAQAQTKPAAAPLKAEVIHWWTSGGESAAVKALADAYTAAGGAWKDTAVALGEQARSVAINRIVGGNPPTAAQFNTSKQFLDVVDQGLLNHVDEAAGRRQMGSGAARDGAQGHQGQGSLLRRAGQYPHADLDLDLQGRLQEGRHHGRAQDHGRALRRARQAQGRGPDRPGPWRPALAGQHGVCRRAQQCRRAASSTSRSCATATPRPSCRPSSRTCC